MIISARLMNGTIEQVPHEELRGQDVLLGRGGINFTHSGNTLLRQIAWSWRDGYKTLSKHGKTDLTWKIAGYIQSLGGRFLTPEDSGLWCVSSSDASRKKVAQCLRDAVARKKMAIPPGFVSREKEAQTLPDTTHSVKPPSIDLYQPLPFDHLDHPNFQGFPGLLSVEDDCSVSSDESLFFAATQTDELY